MESYEESERLESRNALSPWPGGERRAWRWRDRSLPDCTFVVGGLDRVAWTAKAGYADPPMLRRLARTLLLLLAVLGLLPGASQAMEQIAELIEHGHPAHSVPGEPDRFADEHGCTPIQHQCPCHEGQSVAYNRYAVGAANHAEWLTWMMDVDLARLRAMNARHPSVNDALPRSLAHGPPTPPPNA